MVDGASRVGVRAKGFGVVISVFPGSQVLSLSIKLGGNGLTNFLAQLKPKASLPFLEE